MRSLFFATLILCSGCFWKTTELENQIPLCISQGQSEDTLSVNILLGCTNECSKYEEFDCQASLDGNNITVTSSHVWKECVGCICTDNCFRSLPIECNELGPIEPGTYTITYGDQTWEQDTEDLPERCLLSSQDF